MTKEELKQKLASDPEARARFIESAARFYREIGLDVDEQELQQQSQALAATRTQRDASATAATNISITIA